MKHLALLLVVANIAAAQNSPNTQIQTSGVCSPVVDGSQNKVQITCDTAMDEATQKKFVALLNKILNNTKDANATNKKLDDVLAYMKRLEANSTTITQGQGSAFSMNQQGGITAGTVIGEIPPPPRELSGSQRLTLIDAVAKYPDEILILYAQGDDEAFKIATQIGNALTAAGWKLSQPVTAAMVMPEGGGGPVYGMEVDYHGPEVPKGAEVSPDPNTSSGALVWTLFGMFPKAFGAHPAPTNNRIVLTVNRNPEAQ